MGQPVVGQVVAVVPARGGSARVTRKNVRSFNGNPMITWPLSAAAQSGRFERVVVSTDDEEIAAIAREAGAEVPFTRPANLADQHAGTAPVIRHAITELGLADDDIVVCLYPTAAITSEILSDALDRRRLIAGALRHFGGTTPFSSRALTRSQTRPDDGAGASRTPAVSNPGFARPVF